MLSCVIMRPVGLKCEMIVCSVVLWTSDRNGSVWQDVTQQTVQVHNLVLSNVAALLCWCDVISIQESYPSTPPIWFVDSDDPSLTQVLERLEDVRRGNTLVGIPVCVYPLHTRWWPAENCSFQAPAFLEILCHHNLLTSFLSYYGDVILGFCRLYFLLVGNEPP